MANYKGHIAGGLVLTAVYAAAVSFTPIERFAEAAGVGFGWQGVGGVVGGWGVFFPFSAVCNNF